ncbi:hypothetical protein H2203_001351 [Taxawa tesnikishii (nom. ined.)]|nr:hypothetical protein H2203_001351 [Dothideales sp. JES 119]
MADLGEDVLTRVSTSAAENLTDAYYNALNSARQTIASFYVPQTALPNGKSLPSIVYNGEVSSDPVAFQEKYQNQMPYTFFDVQALNAHVINPSIASVDPATKNKKDLENNMSILVQVSGSVRLVERKEGPLRGFSDTLVLVPNKEEIGAKGKGKVGEGRSWLIQSQNFRFVV